MNKNQNESVSVKRCVLIYLVEIYLVSKSGDRTDEGYTGRWCSELDGRRRPRCVVGCVDVEEFREVHRSKVMDDLKGEEHSPEIDAIFGAWESAMLLKDGCH